MRKDQDVAASFPQNIDQWLLEEAPDNEVVISSRARLARNLPHLRFAPRANDEQLRYIAKRIADILDKNDTLSRYIRLDLVQCSPSDRSFLRESHLISAELEKGGVGREVYLSPSMCTSITTLASR